MMCDMRKVKNDLRRNQGSMDIAITMLGTFCHFNFMWPINRLDKVSFKHHTNKADHNRFLMVMDSLDLSYKVKKIIPMSNTTRRWNMALDTIIKPIKGELNIWCAMFRTEYQQFIIHWEVMLFHVWNIK